MKRAVALFGFLLVHASAVAHAAPDGGETTVETAREDSRAAFREGVAALRAGRWAVARGAFERAYALYPHPSILLNRGLARQKTGDPALAEEDFVRFLQDDPGASPEELASARDALAEVRAALGTLSVAVSPHHAAIRVDGREAHGGAIRVAAGRHLVEVTADGFDPARREVEVAPRGETTVSLTLARRGGVETRTVVGVTAAGVGGAALVVAGLSALRASSLRDDYVDPGSARFQDPDTRREGIAFRTTADVALGLAIVGGAVAVVLLATDWGRSRSPGSPALVAW